MSMTTYLKSISAKPVRFRNWLFSLLNESLDLLLQVVFNLFKLLKIAQPVLVILRQLVIWILVFFVAPAECYQ